MDQGITVSPVMVETEDGQEVLGDFQIEGHPPGYDSHDVNHQGMSDYAVDRFGRQHHELENLNFEEFDEDPELEGDHIGYFLDNIIELAGGPAQYNSTINWARNNLTEEQQRQYNAAMDSRDEGTIEAAVIELMHYRQESQTPQEELSDQPDEPMFEEDQQTIFDELGGRHVYEHMTDWARNEMPEDQIERFNQLMSHGSKREVQIGVQWLVNQYRQANTRG